MRRKQKILHSAARCTAYAAALFLALLPTAGALELFSYPVKPADFVLEQPPPVPSSAIDLKGSRGEVLAFTLRIPLGECGKLQVSEFESGLVRPKARVFSMSPVLTTKASFSGASLGSQADPLHPWVGTQDVCEAPAIGPWRWFWVDLELPESIASGKYSSAMRLKEKSYPIHLQVWKMKMPEVSAFTVHTELSPWFVVKGHHGKWSSDEGSLAALYLDSLKEHRVFPLKTWVRVPKIEKGEFESLDFLSDPDPASSFSTLVLKRFSKSAYLSVPGPEVSEPAEVQARYWRAMNQSLYRLQPHRKLLYWIWDEPKESDLSKILEAARLAHRWAPQVKILLTTPWTPSLASAVDIWVPVAEHLDRPRLPKKSKAEEWFYVSCMSHGCGDDKSTGSPDLVIDRPSVYVRALPFVAEHYGLKAFLYYSSVNGYRLYPEVDPWNSLWEFTGNGDGTLFYPGRPGEHGFKTHQPVASVRLKLLRQASIDGQYLAWMRARKASWLRSELAPLVQDAQHWSRSSAVFQRLRDKIGRELDQGPALP